MRPQGKTGASSRWLVAVALAAGSGAACGHAHEVEPPQTPAAEKSSAREEHLSERSRSENGVPLSTSGAGLLKPGGVKQIQQRLAHEGALHGDHASEKLDADTRAALSRFQSQHDLPATGEPDDATVRKLGLKPSDVFEAGPDRAKKAQ